MLLGIASILSVGIIDAFYIGRLGSDPLAAVSFIFPVTIAISSLGVGIIAGIGSVVSRALGENDLGTARIRGNIGLVMAGSVGLLIAATLFVFKGPLFALMQADASLRPLIDDYMKPYALGFPLLLTIMGCNGMLRGEGAAKRASLILLSFAVTNWILDPIFITGWMVDGFEGYGIAGAAYATICGWGVGLALAVALVQTGQLKLSPQAVVSDRANWKKSVTALVKVGGPAAISNAINPIGLSILTALLASAGKDAVAGFGAAGRLQSFAIVPLLALSSGIGALVGQNWGARQDARAKLALVHALGFSAVYGLLVACVLVFLRESFSGFFSDNANVRDAIESYIAIAAWGFSGYGALVVSNGALNAIDRAPLALGQSSARVFLVMLPLAWSLGFVLDERAIYIGELVANLLGGTLAAAVGLWFLSRR